MNDSSKIMRVTAGVAVLLSVLIWPLSQLGKGESSDASGDAAEVRILPVARVEMRQAAAPSDGKPRSGEAVYNSICKACHEAGVAGAPKTGDKAAWAPRLATGNAALLKSAIGGKNAMPPRGGAADLSDEELKAAVEYLTGKAR